MSGKNRNLVDSYRGVGTFRAQHAQKSGRAAQRTALPPRCSSCRLPGIHRIMVDDVAAFHCDTHVPLAGQR